ncbi:GNAT family N-acetyltransferase [Mucilaginibacter sp. FT3.2]|uniref:GNAT family N-acetyltransferase n=1 Tax=Mucilaginibacter sp. FT3.2 TaxID=2723090 RepID=UPI001607EC36|nr:GNAT family N-acetyltransferase [Mucilaginibacter sp. FT3.2]MBB6231615.1 hypothetical protein [Mucilaginibacter sp. FT3.2]
MSNINTVDARTIKKLSATTLNDLARLHAAVYGKQVQPGYFECKYNTAYTSVNYIGFIAYDIQLQPIAFYGVIPCFIYCDGETILSAQSADTMTHPNHRNKGLFVELARLTFQLCIQSGIKLLFGFPNQNSLPGFINKLGWQAADRMDCFVIPVKAFPIQKIGTKFHLFKKLYSWYSNFILKTHLTSPHAIGSSVLKDGYGGVLRNEDYLQSKTYNVTKVITFNGANIWIKINNDLLIGDMIVSTENFAATMQHLIKTAQRLGVNQLQFHTSRGTQLHQLFAARYQPINSFPIIFKDLGNGLPTGMIKFTFADIDIF